MAGGLSLLTATARHGETGLFSNRRDKQDQRYGPLS